MFFLGDKKSKFARANKIKFPIEINSGEFKVSLMGELKKKAIDISGRLRLSKFKNNGTIDFRRTGRSGKNRKINVYRVKKEKNTFLSPFVELWRNAKMSIIRFTITAAVVVVICVGINATDYKLGYEVLIDGENIGLVLEKDIVYKAIKDVANDVLTYKDDANYTKEPVFVRRVVAEKKLTSEDEIATHLLSHIDYMVDCYSIRINDKPVLGVTSQEAAEWVLNQYKGKYASFDMTDDSVLEFCEDVQIKKEFLHIGMLETPQEALDIISGNTKESAKYTTKPNDTLWGIARAYDTTVDKILSLNQGLTENIKDGVVINVEESVPLLSVKTVQTLELTEPIPYETQTINDDNMYKDTKEVAVEGIEGQERVLAKVTKINGVEQNREVLEKETISQPIAKVEKIGTKERPSTTGSGKFIRPAYGSLSSRYGHRWGRKHNGIDVAGTYNSNILAADGGKVVYAGWMDGYGNYVVINHENGYQTAYGHCASLLVSVGQRVSQGEVIAKMGNTGDSTGTHLHFEVKVNNSFADPLGYVKY